MDAQQGPAAGAVDDTATPPTCGRRPAARCAAWRSETKPQKSRSPRASASFLSRTPIGGGAVVWDRARARVLDKTGGHYPAPLVAIDIVREGGKLPLRRALDLEAGAFAELVVSPTAKSLISIFFAKTEVEARAAKIARAGRPVGTVGVLGAGFMGAGIAQVLAQKGVPVVLKDRDLAAVGRGYGFARQQFRDRVKRRRTTDAEAKRDLGRILPTVETAALRRADFVIEAVFEDLEVKRAVLRETEAVAPQNLIFASNTSAIPITRLAEASRSPERVVGMHFFSPVAKMPLLEVVRHPGTSAETLATTVEVGRKMGKTVIVVGDGPGFFTSRVLGAMLNEAAWMLAEGADVERVDQAMTRWGWPVGPFALLDEVGLDVARHAGQVVRDALGERVAPPAIFEKMIGDRRLGRKSKRGFYLYEEKEGKKGEGEDGEARGPRRLHSARLEREARRRRGDRRALLAPDAQRDRPLHGRGDHHQPGRRRHRRHLRFRLSPVPGRPAARSRPSRPRLGGGPAGRLRRAPRRPPAPGSPAARDGEPERDLLSITVSFLPRSAPFGFPSKPITSTQSGRIPPASFPPRAVAGRNSPQNPEPADSSSRGCARRPP